MNWNRLLHLLQSRLGRLLLSAAHGEHGQTDRTEDGAEGEVLVFDGAAKDYAVRCIGENVPRQALRREHALGHGGSEMVVSAGGSERESETPPARVPGVPAKAPSTYKRRRSSTRT